MICIPTVKKFCNSDISQIENYEKAINDDTQVWHCHHRKETDECLSAKQLKDVGLYYNRPSGELIFLTKSEHHRLHFLGENNPMHKKDFKGENNPMYGKKHSEESKRKNREAHKGENNPMYGIHRKLENSPMYGKHHSEETRRKQSEAHKGIPSHIKGKHRVYDENGKYHYEE